MPLRSVHAAAGATAAGAAPAAAGSGQRLARSALTLSERGERRQHPLAAFVAVGAGGRVVQSPHRAEQLEPPLTAPAVVFVQRHLYLTMLISTRAAVNHR